MATHFESVVRDQLETRRHRLQDAIQTSPDTAYLGGLLHQVDEALARIDAGSYGLCEVCHDSIENDRLAADPLVRLCLDHLTTPERRALEQDLELAARIQAALLPRTELIHEGWQAAYHYEPAGLVSGDYCDLVMTEDGSLYFMLGDVSGKGVAASMLMSHLHALFRTLIGTGLPLAVMLERASRLFCESTLASHYATLVCGRAERDGNVELCNAGHPAPLRVCGSQVSALESTGLPLGLFCREEFHPDRFHLDRGDLLMIYTDGISEGRNPSGLEMGIAPLTDLVCTQRGLPPPELVHALVTHAERFRGGIPAGDDLSLMIIKRSR